MATTGLGPVISLPRPALRPVGLFFDNVVRIPWVDRYGLGVKFQTYDLSALPYEALPSGQCDDVDTTITPRDFTDVEEQGAFSVLDAVTCSTLGKTREELNDDLALHWELTISAALANEAKDGTGGSTHNFTADATDAGATATAQTAVAEFEERLALTTGNVRGMIHMAPSLLVYAITNGIVNRRGDQYFTPGGHIVVADAGYQETEASTTSVAYATGPVYFAMSERFSRAQYDFEFDDVMGGHNDLLALEEVMGIILYDPNTVFSSTVTKA